MHEKFNSFKKLKIIIESSAVITTLDRLQFEHSTFRSYCLAAIKLTRSYSKIPGHVFQVFHRIRESRDSEIAIRQLISNYVSEKDKFSGVYGGWSAV